MIYQLLWRKLIQERNKILNFLHQKNAILAKVVVLNQDTMRGLVLCVGVTVKLDRAKVFLQFNKLAHNAHDLAKKLLIHALAVEDKEKNKHQRDYQ